MNTTTGRSLVQQSMLAALVSTALGLAVWVATVVGGDGQLATAVVNPLPGVVMIAAGAAGATVAARRLRELL